MLPGLFAPAVIVATRPPPRNIDINSSTYNLDLRGLHDAYYPSKPPTAQDTINFFINGGVIVGGSGTVSLNVGSWPAGAKVTLVNRSRIQGYGGNGGNGGGFGGDVNGQPGGTALYARFPLNLVTTGAQIWGGGGGGGGADNWGNGSGMYWPGGGGCGSVPGASGPGPPAGLNGTPGTPGTSESGGSGSHWGQWYNIGDGGGPGQAGNGWVPGGDPSGTVNRTGVGGAAGYCIDGAGYLTWGVWSGKFVATGVNDGDVRGSVG